MKSPSKNTLIYVASVIGLAALNYAGASLGKLMAIPPGNVTPVWPPAGIAFAVLLLFGYRLWPGIWLGSFLFNLSFFYQEHYFVTLPAVLCSAGIASGSTLQAIAGLQLSKCLVGFTVSDWSLNKFFKLLLICGPLSCLLGATIGTGSLALTHAISPPAYMNTWMTWWFGDSIGVLVLGGIIVNSVHQLKTQNTSENKRYKTQLTRIFSVLLLSFTMSGTLWTWQLLRNEVHQNNVNHFEKLTDEAEANLKARLLNYEDALSGARGFIQASGSIDKNEWQTYVDSLKIQQRFPGILGIGYVANVEPKDLDDYLTNAYYRYGVSLHTVKGPRKVSKDYFIIQFIEPITSNSGVLGLDIGSEQSRRMAAELARTTGTARITAPIRLVQDEKKEPGFLLLLPVYRTHFPVRNSSEREKALRGWVYAPFIGRNIFSGIAESSKISFAVYDHSIHPKNLIYNGIKQHSVNRAILRRIRTFEFSGRKWFIVWESTSDFQQDTSNSQPAYILFFGLFSSLLLASLLINLNTSREQALKMVDTATTEIENQNSLLQATNSLLEKELAERQLVERELREVTRRMQLILDAMGEGIFGFDGRGKVQFINPSAASMLGCPVEEILAMEQTHAIFHHTKADGTPYPQEECIIRLAAHEGVYKKIDHELFWRKDGTSFPVEYSATPVFQEDRLEGVVVVFRDITEKLTQERLLREASMRFKAIFHQSFQFIGLMSPDGKLLEANQSALKAAGIRAEDVINRFFWETPWWSHSTDLQQQVKDAVHRASRNEFIRFEATHPTPSGEEITVDFSLKPLLDENGNVALLIPEGRDITYIKKIEEEHREMVVQLRETARMRRTFVSTLTHDLRTPLIAQKRVLSSLQNETAISEDVRLSSLIKGFLQNNTDLLQMVNNLLETYELEDGRIKLFPERIDLYQLAQGCCLELQEILETKGIVLDNNIASDFSLLEADVLLLKRLFHNLISNAISNIPSGSRISLEALDWGKCVDISVKDNGPGISEDLIPHLFTRYLSGASTRKKIGSGLGLYICKMISELHGGTIRVDSSPQAGTTVSFTLPKESIIS